MLNIVNLSFWERQTYFENIDFLIIGSGLVGSSTAFHLRLKNPTAKIVILEQGYLPSGASTKNAGFACFGSATELLDDLNKCSEHQVWETVAMRWEGLQYLRSIIGDDYLDFQPNGSWDILTNQEENKVKIVQDRLDYLNEMTFQITGERDTYTQDNQMALNFGMNNVSTSFKNRLEGQINTGKMMKRYQQVLSAKDIQIINGISVKKIDPDNATVETEFGEVKAQHLFVCTNGFAAQLLPTLDVQPARAQVLVTEKIPDLKIRGTFHYQEGYYYFRNLENRILLGGGRNLDFEAERSYKLETTEKIQTALLELLNHTILPNRPVKIEYQWSGIMGVGNTKQPIIEKLTDKTTVAVRMGGMGVAIGSLVGKKAIEDL